MKISSRARLRFFVPIFLCLLSAHLCFGWGKDGHRLINRVAVEMLPEDVPAFLRTPAALAEIEYLGPEPDRWRSPATPELDAAQAPDHFIDLELAELAAPDGLPPRRFDFYRDLAGAPKRYPSLAENLTPQRVGLLPWQAEEYFERLTEDMREYRSRLAAHRPIASVEQAILYDAGVLGHYVADGSQPLHTTIDYNGWAEPLDPDGFSRARGIHSRFETQFVQDNLHAFDIRSLVPVKPRILNFPFDDFVAYLRVSHRQVTELYRQDQRHGFEGAGTPESRSFTAERLAAGATMLRDMIVTAWVQSAQPDPLQRE